MVRVILNGFEVAPKDVSGEPDIRTTITVDDEDGASLVKTVSGELTFYGTAYVVGLGNNRKWFERIHRGRMDMDKLMKPSMGVAIVTKDGMSDAQVERITRAIDGIPKTQVHMDGDGISLLVRGRLNQRAMLNSRR